MQTGSEIEQPLSLASLQRENEALKQKVQWLESILYQVPAMVYTCNNNTKTITWCNQCLLDTTGYSWEEIDRLGMEFFRHIMHPDDIKLAPVAQQSFRNNKGKFGGLARVRKKGEEEFRWLLGLEVPFSHDEQGQVEELVCAFIDLTDAIDTNLQISTALAEILRRQNENLLNKLTTREKDVLALAVQGWNNKEIALQLNLSRYTVETHRKNIRLKLKVRNTSELVAVARKIGFH